MRSSSATAMIRRAICSARRRAGKAATPRTRMPSKRSRGGSTRSCVPRSCAARQADRLRPVAWPRPANRTGAGQLPGSSTAKAGWVAAGGVASPVGTRRAAWELRPRDGVDAIVVRFADGSRLMPFRAARRVAGSRQSEKPRKRLQWRASLPTPVRCRSPLHRGHSHGFLLTTSTPWTGTPISRRKSASSASRACRPARLSVLSK